MIWRKGQKGENTEGETEKDGGEQQIQDKWKKIEKMKGIEKIIEILLKFTVVLNGQEQGWKLKILKY